MLPLYAATQRDLTFHVGSCVPQQPITGNYGQRRGCLSNLPAADSTEIAWNWLGFSPKQRSTQGGRLQRFPRHVSHSGRQHTPSVAFISKNQDGIPASTALHRSRLAFVPAKRRDSSRAFIV